MNEETSKWHNMVLNHYKTDLFSTLIHEHNTINETPKEITISEEYDATGFFAIKNRKKYFILEEYFKSLPIKAGTKFTKFKHSNDDIVLLVNEPIPFKITPEHTMTMRSLIDNFMPFNHTNLDGWRMCKIISVASYVGRTYICIATDSAFGKTSAFNGIHSLTDKCPVFKPRSIPGVLNQITNTGNMVFDDVLDANREVRGVMEEMSIHLGDNRMKYINGALKSHNTKEEYNCSNQSITYLYNSLDHYKDPDKYFDKMFSNNGAIHKRFLKFKFYGEIKEDFRVNFDIVKTSAENKMFYINYAKELAYLQELKLQNKYVRQWDVKFKVKLGERKRNIMDQILWILDMYCENQEEFDKYSEQLISALADYKEMVRNIGQYTPL